MCAEMAAELEINRALVWYAAHAFDQQTSEAPCMRRTRKRCWRRPAASSQERRRRCTAAWESPTNWACTSGSVRRRAAALHGLEAWRGA